MKKKDLEALNESLQLFITRSMIALSLVENTGMSDSEAWDFSQDLDWSIEEEYLPIEDVNERFRKIMADSLEYAEGEK